MRKALFVALAVLVGGLMVTSGVEAARPDPGQFKVFVPQPRLDPSLDHTQPMVYRATAGTTWIQVHASDATCTPGGAVPGTQLGGLLTGGPDLTQTYCFEGGDGDTCGTLAPYDTNCFTRRDGNELELQPNPWHVDTYRADVGVSLWCGSLDGSDVSPCEPWASPPGYPDALRANIEWDTDLIVPTDSIEIAGRIAYDLECNYDYAMMDVSFDGGASWSEIARINGTSGHPASGPNDLCGGDFLNNTFLYNSPIWQDFSVKVAGVGGTSAGDFLVRWRTEADFAWSDQDASGDTQGALYLDNLTVTGDAGGVMTEDFEGPYDTDGLPFKWDKAGPDLLGSWWRVRPDVDPPNEDGESASGLEPTCDQNGTWIYNVAPHKKYSDTTKWLPDIAGLANMQLWTPKIVVPAVGDRGVVLQYDQYVCFNTLFTTTDDAGNEMYRVYDSNLGDWCEWLDNDGYTGTVAGCEFWNLDSELDLGGFSAPAQVDTIQVRFEFKNFCLDPASLCWGKHKGNDFIIDNVSIGYYDASASSFAATAIEMLRDSYDLETCLYTSSLWNSELPRDSLQTDDSLTVEVRDPDGLKSGGVLLFWSDDGGLNFTGKTMTRSAPLGSDTTLLWGVYTGTVCPIDLGGATWTPGTEILYYVRAEDVNGAFAYFPSNANPAVTDPVGPRYFEASIHPFGNADTFGKRGLLVASYERNINNYLDNDTTVFRPTKEAYIEALDNLGYGYDVFDVRAGASNQKKEPWTFVVGDSLLYDYIVWFTGPGDIFGMRDTAQMFLMDYVNKGGNLWVTGEAILRDLLSPDPSDPGFDDKGIAADYFGANVANTSDPTNSFHLSRTLHVGGFLAQGTDDADFRVMNDCPILRSMDSVTVEPDDLPSFNHEALFQYDNLGPGEAGTSPAAVYTEVNVITGKTGRVVWSSFGPEFVRGVGPRTKLVHEVLEGKFGFVAPNGLQTDVASTSPSAVHRLGQNQPNPFNPHTEISFTLAQRVPVTLEVYNILGQVVRTLLNEERTQGTYNVAWDGLNDAGEQVTSGVYFYKLHAGSFTETRKMVLVR